MLLVLHVESASVSETFVKSGFGTQMLSQMPTLLENSCVFKSCAFHPSETHFETCLQLPEPFSQAAIINLPVQRIASFYFNNCLLDKELCLV